MSMLIKPELSDLAAVQAEAVPALLSWLTHQHSLTDRLREQTNTTRLEVLNEQWTIPNHWDIDTLSLDSDRVWLREIVMFGDEVPCWYARTIVPQNTYEKHLDLFARLEQESLGELIFNNPMINRAYLLHYPINEVCDEYKWLQAYLPVVTKMLWVRLAAFTFGDNCPFFLVEILLPGLESYLN